MKAIERAALGALAGICATMLMTMIMRRGHAALPPRDAYPLPPRELTERIAGPVGGVTTMLAHFAYGGAAGALFAVMQKAMPAAAYGPLVWAASYLGWIPLTGRLQPATHHPAKRNFLMIFAHVVWGSSLGIFLTELMRTEQTAFGTGTRADAPAEEHGR
jgi:uncharacterized membrane protein YagU involved in acid resistance